jgi:hypothetical protein
MKLIFNFKWELINKLPSNLQERYLDHFSGDKDWGVRYYVADHPNTPVHILQKLSEDVVQWVRNNATVNLEKRR